MARQENLTLKEIKKIKTLLESEIATRKNHLVSSILSRDSDYRARAEDCAEEIKEMNKLFAKFNGADMVLEGRVIVDEPSDVTFFAYHNQVS